MFCRVWLRACRKTERPAVSRPTPKNKRIAVFQENDDVGLLVLIAFEGVEPASKV
jgi:hypothetical protein